MATLYAVVDYNTKTKPEYDLGIVFEAPANTAYQVKTKHEDIKIRSDLFGCLTGKFKVIRRDPTIDYEKDGLFAQFRSNKPIMPLFANGILYIGAM